MLFTRFDLNHTFRIKESTGLVGLPTTIAYPTGFIPINKKKMDERLKMKRFLPETEAVKIFYDVIFNWPTCVEDTHVDYY